MKLKYQSAALMLSYIKMRTCYDAMTMSAKKGFYMEMLLGFGFLGTLIALGLGVFWLWMLIDCLAEQKEDKLVWFLVVFFLNLLGAFLYYLLARKKRTG